MPFLPEKKDKFVLASALLILLGAALERFTPCCRANSSIRDVSSNESLKSTTPLARISIIFHEAFDSARHSEFAEAESKYTQCFELAKKNMRNMDFYSYIPIDPVPTLPVEPLLAKSSLEIICDRNENAKRILGRALKYTTSRAPSESSALKQAILNDIVIAGLLARKTNFIEKAESKYHNKEALVDSASYLSKYATQLALCSDKTSLADTSHICRLADLATKIELQMLPKPCTYRLLLLSKVNLVCLNRADQAMSLIHEAIRNDSHSSELLARDYLVLSEFYELTKDTEQSRAWMSKAVHLSDKSDGGLPYMHQFHEHAPSVFLRNISDKRYHPFFTLQPDSF